MTLKRLPMLTGSNCTGSGWEEVCSHLRDCCTSVVYTWYELSFHKKNLKLICLVFDSDLFPNVSALLHFLSL